MKVFHIEISFLNKPSQKKIITMSDNLTSLTHVLNSLSLEEKDNVLGVKVTYIGE